MIGKRVRAVLFDWDGTLVDTSDSSYRCFERTFADLGIAFDRVRYAETYSPNWHHTYRCVGLPEEKWPEADAAWLRYFGDERTVLIDGVREVLDAMPAVVRGIVTSGTRVRIERELQSLGVDHHFHHVVCGDDGWRRKPDPEPLRVCLERLNVAPDEAVYVGDSPEDVQMAKAAGVFAIAIPGPYPNGEALSAARPDLFATSLVDVLELLA